MSTSVKISQLVDGGSLTSSDYIPVSRGTLDTFKVAATQIVTDGQNIGIGNGNVFKAGFDAGSRTLQFRTLSGTDGISVTTNQDTVVVSASGQNPIKTSLTGNGTTTVFPINGAVSINPNNYRVDIDGVLQEPTTNYTVNGSNIVFFTPPPTGGKITVISNNLVRVFDTIPSDGSVTPQKLSTNGGGLFWNPTQVSIGTTSPDAAAALDITSTTKGFLPPRLNGGQRDSIPNPPEGLIVYNTNTKKLNFYNGTNWIQVG